MGLPLLFTMPRDVTGGALLGAICYATYDLTNQATLRSWSTTVTIADIVWGAFATAVAASAATFAADKFG